MPSRSALQAALARGVHRVEAALEHGFNQGVLGAEVVIDGGEVHARLGCQQAHRGALEAMLHELFFRGIQDAAAGFVLGFYGAECHGDA